MTEEEKKENKKQRYDLVQVPTETKLFVQDNEEEKLLEDKEVLLEILNKLNEIRKIL